MAIIKFKDGTMKALPFRQVVMGWRFESVELDATDAKHMLSMCKANPQEFEKVLAQFTARFEQNRIVEPISAEMQAGIDSIRGKNNQQTET